MIDIMESKLPRLALSVNIRHRTKVPAGLSK